MRFKDLIVKYSYKEMKARMLKLYPDQKSNMSGYEDVFKALQTLPSSKADFKLAVRKVKDGKEKWIDISGEVARSKYKYQAIEFSPWGQWLDAIIIKDTLKEFTELDIVCHSLWEMTWMGFKESKIQKEMKELERRVKDVKKDLKKKK